MRGSLFWFLLRFPVQPCLFLLSKGEGLRLRHAEADQACQKQETRAQQHDCARFRCDIDVKRPVDTCFTHCKLVNSVVLV